MRSAGAGAAGKGCGVVTRRTKSGVRAERNANGVPSRAGGTGSESSGASGSLAEPDARNLEPRRAGPCIVLGLGSSGVAAARLLRAEGREVAAVDLKDGSAQQQAAAALRADGVTVELGIGPLPDRRWALAVVSPGVPLTSVWMEDLAARGVPRISELELGWSRFRGRTVAVTGSNGKSSAVKWIAESLAAGGVRAVIAGNYGPPACAVVRESGEADWLVLEVSSFQLETCRDFRADVGVVLNVQPNHLDRHGTFEAYLAAKARMFARTRSGDVRIVPDTQIADIRHAAARRFGRWVTFGETPHADYRFRDGVVVRGRREAASIRGTYFDNEILGRAAAAVVAAVEACGMSGTAAARAAEAFQPLPHRLQLVREIGGVRYVDDSKATTLAAMVAALRMTGRGVRLIAGGRPKEKDFSGAKEMLARVAVKAYLMGECAERMCEAWTSAVPCEVCGTLAGALEAARRDARSGETVLLSPACTSFDQFRSFEERGDEFTRRVREADQAPGPEQDTNRESDGSSKQ